MFITQLGYCFNAYYSPASACFIAFMCSCYYCYAPKYIIKLCPLRINNKLAFESQMRRSIFSKDFLYSILSCAYSETARLSHQRIGNREGNESLQFLIIQLLKRKDWMDAPKKSQSLTTVRGF